MSRQGVEMFDLRASTNLKVAYDHRAGVLMEEADELSRRKWTHVDWSLNRRVLDLVCKHWNIWPQVDLFASRTNAKAEKYFTYEHDRQAMGRDCFLHQWDRLGRLYAFPPPILVGRILLKIQQEQVRSIILITPAWTSSHWWPGLLQMADRPPIVLPCQRSLCWDPGGKPSFHSRYHLLA